MFTSLPASKAAPSRSGGEAAFSIAFHLALLATAVWLTSTRAALLYPARATAVYYVAPQPRPAPPPAAVPRATSPPLAAPPSISVPLDAPASLPPIDVALPSAVAPHFVVGPAVPGTAAGAPAVEHIAGSPYDASLVDTPVALLARQPLPRYPETLRSAGVEGRVMARFVVDTLGRVEPASVEISETTHTLFADAVRAALLRQRFLPAVAGGRLVRQLVVQPFEFRIRS